MDIRTVITGQSTGLGTEFQTARGTLRLFVASPTADSPAFISFGPRRLSLGAGRTGSFSYGPYVVERGAVSRGGGTESIILALGKTLTGEESRRADGLSLIEAILEVPLPSLDRLLITYQDPFPTAGTPEEWFGPAEAEPLHTRRDTVLDMVSLGQFLCAMTAHLLRGRLSRLKKAFSFVVSALAELLIITLTTFVLASALFVLICCSLAIVVGESFDKLRGRK
ncbi:MAG: hypothetical protein KDD44_09520 [Bdellovibrionales bacterium]|nr:hypothetical protein [Bdellovibrionales bacterium]